MLDHTVGSKVARGLRGLTLCALGLLGLHWAGCGGGGGSGSRLVRIEVTPAISSLAKGTVVQYTATGIYSNNTHRDLTGQVTWNSSDGAIAAVSNGAPLEPAKGMVSGLVVGAVTVTARLGKVAGNTPVTITNAALVSIAVDPPLPTIANGTTQQFTATGTFTDASTQDLTTTAIWSSSDTAVAVTSNAVGSEGLATAVGVGVTTITAASGAISGSTTLTVTAATLVSVEVTPPDPSIASGTTQQFTATGVYTDASTQDLTTSVTWSSSDTGAATVSNAVGSEGLASAGAVGVTTITATSGVISGSTTLTVTAAALVSIDVTPADPSIASGLTEQFTATGTYTDASTQDLTTTVTWSSLDTGVATISNAPGSEGLAAAGTPGVTTITATSGAISGSTTLTVTAATLVSIGVTPANPSTANGLTEQFTATGVYTDSSTQDLTTTVTWSSSDTAVATISNAAGSEGLASTSDVGPTTITATSGAISGSTTLTVTAATLASIGVTPANPSVANGLTEQFTATGVYTDSSTQDLTSTVTWSSSDTAVATISNAAGSEGLASTSDVGPTTITATFGAVSDSTTLTVTAATLVSIGVTPANPSLPKGLTEQCAATGIYTDATTQDLTATVSWSSSDTGVATISNAAGSEGLASATDVGPTTITATSGAISGSTTLTVTDAVLQSITFVADDTSVPLGLTHQYTATGNYSDGSTQDLTATVTWSSSNTGVATISNAAGSEGLATAGGLGVTTITATSGLISGTTTLTVTNAVLQSITVTPANADLPLGLSQQYTATGNYSDASTQDLTTTVAWSSSNTGRATISNAAGSEGLASTNGVGATTITATSGAISGSTTLTVTSATLVSIAVTPDNPSIADGLTQQFTATGTYTDASTQDLTAVVTWLSSDTGKATISNAAGSNGLATASEIGVTTITAVSGLISDSTTLTVTPAELQSISIAPANASVPLGLTQQYTATGHYTDASTQNLTATVTWSSSDTGVATISNVGLASTVAEGPTTITATLDALSANTSLTVTPVALISIALTPANSTQPRNSSFQMTATGTYSNGLTANVTTSANWISSFPSKISVNDTTNKGLVTVGTQPNQTVTITATVGSVSGNTQVSSNN
jgi:hypothetical protein